MNPKPDIAVVVLPESGLGVAVMRNADRTSLICDVALGSLGVVLETALRYGLAPLRSDVAARRSRSWEGVLGFTFHDDYPDEVRAGHACVYFRDEEVTLTLKDFDAAVEAISHRGRRLKPRHHVGVRDLRDDQSRGGNALVADIYADGSRGVAILHQERFRGLIGELFSSPVLWRPPTVVTPGNGPRGDAAPRSLKAWSKAALLALCESELPAHRMCGEFEGVGGASASSSS